MTRFRFAISTGMLAGALVVPWGCAAQDEPRGPGLTAVEGLKLGHFTLDERPTGCTVILAEDGVIGGVDVRGGSPGTRDLALLDPVNSVDEVHAVVLSGGSAFGLDAVSGAQRWLEEQGHGYRFGGRVIPIAVGAILFDLGVGDASIRPDAECGYRAAQAATAGPPAEGSVGAGAGATVGKLTGMGGAMKGGIGTASITLENGLTVAAVVAVNAAGDIIDPSTGQVVAGARRDDGTFVDARELLRGRWGTGGQEGDDAAGRGVGADGRLDLALADGIGQNTTIGLVATNATLTKTQATKMAQMAHDGLARAIYPAHTPGDGDTMFSLATGAWDGEVSMTVIGGLAADMVSEAILRAVRNATGLPGIPSVSELEPPE